ncbi:MAG: adenylate/guanylate cyclase domain-containing protein [Bacteroidales bacterium]|nr:adenylate/guanylate cyclase domain-containing protein [Bacteroidales bacterium]
MHRFLITILIILADLILSQGTYGQDSLLCVKRILLDYDSVLYDINRDNEIRPLYVLDNQHNNLLIECREKVPGTKYSFFLEGNDKKWSIWFDRPVKEYTNLRAGSYVLHARDMAPGAPEERYRITSFRVRPPFYFSPLALLIYLGILFLIFYLLIRNFVSRQKSRQAHLESIIQERTEELMSEKEKTDTLLANLLPKGTADEIMSKGKATKQKYNFVTVLFSDIEGFTRIAEEVNPEILIDELDNFFFHFDSVVEKYNIEKIKTIGDAYMCAGGIPHPNRTNPVEVVMAALEMQDYMEGLKEDQTLRGVSLWDIRIGVHTGTVIAGVVGQKKLSYDIWGDTVNTASRMESSGLPGRINISGVTYEYVKDFFICEYRGKMPVKYKGDLEMYFVKGIRPELRGKGKIEPNELFVNRLLTIGIQDLEDYYFAWYSENVPDDFVFHNTKFIKNICTQTELIARAEKLDEVKILWLRLAALFVKSGLLSDYISPVEQSVNKLRELAPEFGFRTKYIEQAESIIRGVYSMETGRKEVQILMDAINDYCGHVDYPDVVEQHFKEESTMMGLKDKEKWYTAELERIKKHEFYTDTARLLRSYTGEEQAENLEKHIKHIK